LVKSLFTPSLHNVFVIDPVDVLKDPVVSDVCHGSVSSLG
jgi:hypothetical protein